MASNSRAGTGIRYYMSIWWGAGFYRNPVDHCIYSKQVNNNQITVLIWVDDLIVASDDNQFKGGMKRQFKMNDLGRISLFLGIDFNQSCGVIEMNQKRYIRKMLNRFGTKDCKPRATPSDPLTSN